MASNFKTVINFRDGIQVDTDDIVSTGGKVGIGSTIPRDTLDVRGNTIIDGGVEASSLDVSGVSTVAALDNTNLNVSGVGTVGGLNVESGIVTASSGVVTYYGDGSNLINLPAAQWTPQGGNAVYIEKFVGIQTQTPTSDLEIGQLIKMDASSGIITAATFTGSLNGVANSANLAALAQGLTGIPDINVGILTATLGNVTGILTATRLRVGSSFGEIIGNNAGILTAVQFVGPLDGTASQARVAAGTTDDPNLVVTSIASSQGSPRPFYLFSSGISTFEGDLTVNQAIGIGTNAPLGGLSLDIRGNSQIQGNARSDTLSVGAFQVAANVLEGGRLNFNNTGISTIQSLRVPNTAYVHSQLRCGSTVDPTQALDVTGNALVSNNLGIGTTNAAARLDIGAGSALIRNNFYIGTNFADHQDETKNHILNETLFPPPINGAGSDGANIGIGTTTARAALDMGYAGRPMIFPILTTVERDAISPTYEGQILYNSDTETLQFRNNAGWAEPGGGTGAVNYWYDGSGTGIGTVGSVGVGTTNPQTTLQVGETYGVTSSGVLSFTAQAGIAFTANSFNINTNNFRTAEYTFHFTYNNSIQSNKLLVMNTGVGGTAYSQEYAIMFNNSLLVSIGATVSGNDLEVRLTPEVGVNGNVTYRFTRETML